MAACPYAAATKITKNTNEKMTRITRRMIAAVLICAGGGLAAKTLTVDSKGGAEFTSIDAAVAVAEPGDTVRVMPGLYRETVVVRRGGTKDKPIVIESAVRGGAVVRGSEVWKNAWAPLDGHPGVLSSSIDESWFTNGVVNPYTTTISIGPGGVGKRARFETNDVADVEKYLPRTLGQMFIEGRPVTEVTSIRALDESPNTWMVSPKGGEVWLHPSVTDIPLDGRLVEWTVRDRLLHAARRSLGYVVVRGFVFEHCANQGPFPQRGAVDVRSGYAWIVEHNIIRLAKTIGLAVGSETWDGKSLTDVPESDRRFMQSVNVHVRHNTVSDNGMCGIAAWNPANLRIYNNVVERNNTGCYWWRCRYWDETAGIKVHCGTTVVANNLIRDNEAHGVWFDTGFHRVRITGNAILNNRRSGIMFETAFGSALVDCNVIAYTRQDGDTFYAGDGIYSHNGSGVTVAHNLLAGNSGMGVRFRTTNGKVNVWTAGKTVRRDVETSGNRYLNNIFYENAAGDLMVSATNRLSNGTVSEGNLYLKDGRRSVRFPFRFADYNIDIKGGFSNVWERVAAVSPSSALPYAAWSALERPATLAEWRAVQGLDTTSRAMSGAYIDTITRDLLLVLQLPKELKEFRGKGVAGIDMDFRGKPYPGPDADVRPGPFVGFDWDDRGVQFALDPFERTTPPAIPVR